MFDLMLADGLVVGHHAARGIDVADFFAMDDEFFVFDRAIQKWRERPVFQQ